MIDDLIAWLSGILSDIQEWFIEIIRTFLGWATDKFLSAILWVIEQIPVPDFVQNYTLADYISPDVIWMATQSGVPEALGILASGIVFYMLRRLLTLGIW